MIINEKKMVHLYLNRGFSTCRLAKKFNCDSKTVWKRLKKLNVPLRTKSEAQTKHKINYKQLKELYLNQKLSTKQIADKFGCWPSTILAKLAKFGIKRRKWYEGVRLRDDRFKKIALANIKYTKKDFNGCPSDKAYLIGFRKGDLHIFRNKNGVVIKVSCSSTKDEQINLFYNLFSRFGHIYLTTNSAGSFLVSSYLNNSFDFLINGEDCIPQLVLKNRKTKLSFLAGYIDAEGCFSTSRSSSGFVSEFSVASYQKNILKGISRILSSFGITNHFKKTVKGGFVDKRGVITKKDLWRVRITSRENLKKFIFLIKPYLKHKKRKKDILNAAKHL